MTTGIERITARRVWFVPNVAVWGVTGLNVLGYLVAEPVGGQTTILYGSADIGEGEQTIMFDQLVDDRGNQLPATIDGPRVVVRPKGETAAFIVGQESDYGFKVARSSATDQPVIVDLFVIENGR